MKTMQIMDERLTLTESRVSSILSMQRGVHPVPVQSNTTFSVGGKGHSDDLQDGADEPLPIVRDILLHQQRQQLLDMKLASAAWPSRQEQQIHGGQNHLHNHRGAEVDRKSSTNVSSTNAAATSFMDIVDNSYERSYEVDDDQEEDDNDDDDDDDDEGKEEEDDGDSDGDM